MAKITYLRRLVLLERDPITGRKKPQYQIAGDIGVDPATFSGYVNGTKEIPWYNRERIAQYFDIDGALLDQWIEIDAE
jgi:hypothetical protein